ncbi:hypothetical protein [Leifsonia shinshuensis]|uniref:Integrase n=1 Tax=Leifsonia shinshuensis TaxID=150026 RepID=A0A853CX12_9MICO|nr:integrase [Leifsonia shinshuensis]
MDDARAWLLRGAAPRDAAPWWEDALLRPEGRHWTDFFAPTPSPQTVQRHESSLSAHILPAFGDLSVSELSNPRLRKWIKALAKDHLAEARNSRVVLRHVLSKGADEGVCTPSLFDFDGIRLAVPKKKARAITRDELERLRNLVADDRARPRSGPKTRKAHDDVVDAIDLALATSLRISEVLGISSQDLDFDGAEPTLNVTAKVEYVRGSGYGLGPVKTATTERGIVLPRFAAEIVQARIETYGPGLIFRSSRAAGGPISQNNLRRLNIRFSERHEYWG